MSRHRVSTPMRPSRTAAFTRAIGSGITLVVTSVMMLAIQTLVVTFEIVGVGALLAPTTQTTNAILDALVLANVIACGFMQGWWLTRSTRVRAVAASVRACMVTVPVFAALVLAFSIPSPLEAAVLGSAVLLGTTLGACRQVATRPRFDRSTVVLAA